MNFHNVKIGVSKIDHWLLWKEFVHFRWEHVEIGLKKLLPLGAITLHKLDWTYNMNQVLQNSTLFSKHQLVNLYEPSQSSWIIKPKTLQKCHF